MGFAAPQAVNGVHDEGAEEADLGFANLSYAKIEGADFLGAMFVGTILGYLDFSKAHGLNPAGTRQ